MDSFLIKNFSVVVQKAVFGKLFYFLWHVESIQEEVGTYMVTTSWFNVALNIHLINSRDEKLKNITPRGDC